ncbi:MAG TPA: hypothetical protein VG674_00290 [Amycolatopsis sp.]|nr:hypothetical protein [Amycolatopsis sp.]
MTTSFDPNAKPDFGAGVVITDANKFSGAGFLDSYTFLIKSCDEIKTADDSDKAALGVSIGLGVVASAVDTVKFALNPLGSLISAGLGWLIEHASFLREPLDMLMGDPDQIQLLSQEVHAVAESIRQIAEDQKSSLDGDIGHWQGPAGDTFKQRMQELAADLDSKAHGTDIVGYLIQTNMAIIAAVRGLFRDLITTVLGDMISTMLIALAAAIPTFGASIVAGVAWCVEQATLTAVSLGSKLAAVVAQATRSAGRIGDVVKSLKARPGVGGATGGGRTAGDIPMTNVGPHGGAGSGSAAHSGDDVATPPPVPPKDNDTPPPVPPKDNDTPPPAHHPDEDTSSTAGNHGHDGTPAANQPSNSAPSNSAPPTTAPPNKTPWTKAHEDWLKEHQPEAYAKYKYLENQLKANYPQSFVVLKQWIADSDSAKEMWAWPVKGGQEIAKQMLDIQKTAETGWANAEENQPAAESH